MLLELSFSTLRWRRRAIGCWYRSWWRRGQKLLATPSTRPATTRASPLGTLLLLSTTRNHFTIIITIIIVAITEKVHAAVFIQEEEALVIVSENVEAAICRAEGETSG